MIDPLKIKESDLPLIVLSDNLQGFFAWITKVHTHGLYSHVMEMHQPGYFASQSISGYKIIPVRKYMLPKYRLKFWKINDMSNTKAREWKKLIAKDLKAPWWVRRYDFIGVGLGQLLKIKWLNNPWTKYCSERVAIHLRKIFGFLIPKHPSPSDLNKLFERSQRYQVYGRWFVD